MLKIAWFSYGFIGLSLILFSFISFKVQQENQAPVVRIVSPQNSSTFDWDTPVNYKITVSDKEDGESKFDEINAKEVLLEIRRIRKGAKIRAGLNKAVTDTPPGLAVITVSNCFNCHNFNSRSIGPSFYAINKRYPASKSNTDSLVKHIKDGSSGIWAGKEKMPSHPELKDEEIKATVQWIMQYAADPDVTYYNGTEGFFRISKPAASPSNETYSIRASYTDHGLKNNASSKHLKGQDVIIIHNK